MRVISVIKKARNRAYKSLGIPRLYYDDNLYLKLYDLPLADLKFYKKNSLTNVDIVELIKKKIKPLFF